MYPERTIMDQQNQKLNWFGRLQASLEALILTRLVPMDNPVPVFRYFSKSPPCLDGWHADKLHLRRPIFPILAAGTHPKVKHFFKERNR